MSSLQDLEYVENIEPTFENAVAYGRLRAQGLEEGGFPDPDTPAYPSAVAKVAIRYEALRRNTQHFSGYTRDGQLVAFIMQNEWFSGDELPFATGLRAFVLKLLSLLGLYPSTGQWGVFGLVVSNALSNEERKSIYDDLLRRSFVDPESGAERIVNTFIHKDPLLLEVATSLGFVAVGKLGEAAGAPGVRQRRYQRPVSK